MTLNQPRFASDSFRLVLTHVADINSAAAWARRLKVKPIVPLSLARGIQ
jgi:hypothetical protein